MLAHLNNVSSKYLDHGQLIQRIIDWLSEKKSLYHVLIIEEIRSQKATLSQKSDIIMVLSLQVDAIVVLIVYFFIELVEKKVT